MTEVFPAVSLTFNEPIVIFPTTVAAPETLTSIASSKPFTSTVVENVETPVTLIPPAPIINPPPPNVKFELSSREPEAPARTTLP